MLSNFIYYGQDFEYRFGDVQFVFKTKKLIVWDDPFNNTIVPSVELYFHLIGNLNTIALEIFNCNPTEAFIPYPDQAAE